MEREPIYWKRIRRRRFLQGTGAAAVGGTMLLAGACGDDDDSGSSGTTTDPKPTVAGQGEQPKTGGRLRELNTSEPDQYDPHRDAGYPGLIVMSAVYNGLLRTRLPIGQDFVIEPDLAAALPEQPDNRTYIFKLPAGTKWQNVAPLNGRALTATDIKKNFERMVTNQPDYVLRPMFDLIDKVETPDEQTVRVTLKSPYGQFLVNTADIWAKVIPPELYDGDKAKVKPVGSGPFIFKDAKQGVGQTLDKNPDYFRKGQPYVDGIDFSLVPDPSASAAAFKSGDLDTYIGTATAIMNQLKADYPAGIYDKRFSVMNPVMINNSAAPFNDARVRQALYYAMDPELITKLGYEGLAEPGQPIPVWLKRYQLPADKMPKRDLKKAKDLLSAAGQTNLSFTNKTFQTGTQYFGTLQLQQSLKEAGITMENKELEWADWRKNVYGITGDFAITIGGEFDYISPDRQLYNAFYSKGSANNRKVNDAKLDKLLLDARQELDNTKAAEAYKEISQYLVDNAISLWMPQGLSIVATQKWTKGWFWQFSAGALFERNFMDEIWLDKKA
ncbi:MAG: ABC transporter substrate-binding protein [Dehalococcoidia bacterium]